MNSSTRLTPLSDRTLRDQVVRKIQEAILNRRLKPGDRLIELDLANELGISRAPIREAIRDLIGRGLLIGSPHRGTFVASWSDKSIIEVCTLRAALEIIAARLAVHHATERDFDLLQSALDRLEAAIHAGDLVEATAQDLAFHRTLVEISGHDHLLHAWTGVGVEALMIFALNRDTTDETTQHQLIVDALRDRGTDQAVRLMQRGLLALLLNTYGIPREELQRHLGPEMLRELYWDAAAEGGSAGSGP